MRTEAQLCIEVCALLSDVLGGQGESRCDLYPILISYDAGVSEIFALLGSKRVPINVKHTAFLSRAARLGASSEGKPRSSSATIISDPAAEIRESLKEKGEVQAPRNRRGRMSVMNRGLGGVNTVTWYDTGVGQREMLVRSESDATQVKATLLARGYEITASGNLLPSEVAQVLVLPLFRPRQWTPLTQERAEDEEEEGEEGLNASGDMVAMVQVRASP